MPSQVPVRGIVFDLGDVLFTWSSDTRTTISAATLRRILASSTWFEYECGHLEQDSCYEQIAREFTIEASQVAEAFSQARESLRPNAALVNFLKQLKKISLVSVYAMSNVAKEDFAALSGKMDWSLFDRVFTSGAVGMRKPEHGFFCHVLKEIKLAPEQVIFVDDNRENVLAADRLGIRAILFDDMTVQNLQNILDGPVARGYGYLYRNAKHFSSVTDSGIVVQDNFAELLILEATQDKNLVNVESSSKRTWNYFAGEATLIPGGYFPDDLDTTSLALTVLGSEQPETVTSVLDQMGEYVTSDGTILTYFDREKPRTDTVVTANVLACFYRFGRGHQLTRTLQHIHDVLLHRTYMHGTRYYPSADCCLGFFGRLLQSPTDNAHLRPTLGPLLISRVQERVGQSGNALDLAMRVLACDSLGIECSVDRHTLLRLQQQDGGWESGWMYRMGSTGVRIGNRGVTTALAVKAIASSVTVSKAAAAAANMKRKPSRGLEAAEFPCQA